MTVEDFENLIRKPESSTLDFKRDLYDFRRGDNISKFIKDVISFSNTIRTEKSYIIFGIEEGETSTKNLIGISGNLDDSILQEKVKDKIFPRPNFSYYTINYDDKLFGIVEFPITKHELPLTPAISAKGLQLGKAYYRMGSSNTEATSIDTIRIYEWFKSLKGFITKDLLLEEISNLIKRSVSKKEKLSVVISESLKVAKKYGLKELEEFFSYQISGVRNEENLEKHKYRIQKILISLYQVQANPYSYLKVTAKDMRREMLQMEKVFEREILFNQSIVSIEENLERFNNNPDLTYGNLELSSKNFFESEKEVPIYCYFFYDNILGVYNNIRQKLIDELMKLQ